VLILSEVMQIGLKRENWKKPADTPTAIVTRHVELIYIALSNIASKENMYFVSSRIQIVRQR